MVDGAAGRASVDVKRSSGPDAEKGLRKPDVGSHVLFKDGRVSRRGIVRFAGVTSFADGWWLGVELPEPAGKNDGSIQGVPYFQCEAQHGLFIRLGKVLAFADSVDRLDDRPPFTTKDSLANSDIFAQATSPWEELDHVDFPQSRSPSVMGSMPLHRRHHDHHPVVPSGAAPLASKDVEPESRPASRQSPAGGHGTDNAVFVTSEQLQHLESRLVAELRCLKDAASSGILATTDHIAKLEGRISDRIGVVENSLLTLTAKLSEFLERSRRSEATHDSESDVDSYDMMPSSVRGGGMSIVVRQSTSTGFVPLKGRGHGNKSFAVRRRKHQNPMVTTPAVVQMRASALGAGDNALALLQKNHETRRASHFRAMQSAPMENAMHNARKSMCTLGIIEEGGKLPRVNFTGLGRPRTSSSSLATRILKTPDMTRIVAPEGADPPPRTAPAVLDDGADDPSLGHEFRGVSVSCLSGVLMNEVLEAGHERSSAVYAIEPEVILTKGQDLICPRDGRPGTAYVDALRGRDNAGFATHMLSYTWGYAIGDIVDALTTFCENQGCEPDRTYFWVCCLCINQHRVREERQKGSTVPFEAFREMFGKRVRGIGHMVALMTPWNNPLYLKRVWCDFEIFTAVSVGEDTCHVSITMPPREVEAMRRTLVNGGSTAEMWKAFTNVKIQEANASVQEDKERILALIEESCGFHFLDSQVAKCLQSWIVSSCESYLETQLQARSLPDEELAQLCSGVARVIGEVGMTTEAERLLQEGYDIFKLADKLRTEKGAVMIMNLGTIKGVNGDHEGQKMYLEEAMLLHKEIGSLQSADGAQLLLNLGACCAMLKDIKSATKYYEVAMTVLENLGTLETTQGATVLMNLACAKGEQGYKESEIKYLEKAKYIREKTGTLETPDGAYLLTCEGIAHAEIDFEEALPFFEQAKMIYEKTGMMGSSDAIELVEKMEMVREALEAG